MGAHTHAVTECVGSQLWLPPLRSPQPCSRSSQGAGVRISVEQVVRSRIAEPGGFRGQGVDAPAQCPAHGGHSMQDPRAPHAEGRAPHSVSSPTSSHHLLPPPSPGSSPQPSAPRDRAVSALLSLLSTQRRSWEVAPDLSRSRTQHTRGTPLCALLPPRTFPRRTGLLQMQDGIFLQASGRDLICIPEAGED